jgi:glycerophosphoryl diester phosphodiesterase
MWNHRTTGRPRVFGHRGAMGHAPENTFASFELALEQGADAIELDVHLSADDEVVVIHDHDLSRTTDGQGDVHDLTLAELRRLDAGSHAGARYAGQRISTLDEVLAWAKGRCVVDVEIKGGPDPYSGIEPRVVDLIRRHAMSDDVIVVSFDHPTVDRVKKLAPEIATGTLYKWPPLDPVQVARKVGADAILPFWPLCDAETVEKAHGAGLSVHPWATSDVNAIAELVALGVDSICSNHPDRVVGVIGGRREG